MENEMSEQVKDREACFSTGNGPRVDVAGLDAEGPLPAMPACNETGKEGVRANSYEEMRALFSWGVRA
jgi:hypothetical protein